MRSSSIIMLTLVCLSGFCLGCVKVTSETTTETDAPTSATGDPANMENMMSGLPGGPGSGADPGVSPAVEPEGELIRAETGVGKQGQSLQDETGVGAMIVQPARSLFAVKQRMVFDVQIPKALQSFEALQGRKPNSHDEYMNVLKTNLIKLPELPAGQTYEYDPEQGELMVRKPG